MATGGTVTGSRIEPHYFFVDLSEVQDFAAGFRDLLVRLGERLVWLDHILQLG